MTLLKMKILLDDKTSEGVIWACLELSARRGLDTIMNTKRSRIDSSEKEENNIPPLPSKQVSTGKTSDIKIKLESPCDQLPSHQDILDVQKPVRSSSHSKRDSSLENLKTSKDYENSVSSPSQQVLSPTVKCTTDFPNKKIKKEATDIENSKASSKRKRESSPTIKRKIYFSDEQTIQNATIEISSDEDTVDFWHTYDYSKNAPIKTNPPITSHVEVTPEIKIEPIDHPLESCSIQTSLQRDLTEQNLEVNVEHSKLDADAITFSETEEDSLDLMDVISRRVREAKLKSMSEDSKTQNVVESGSFYMDQFKNKKGTLIHTQPTESNEYCRTCEICGVRFKDMKQHTITAHLTNSWWGIFGHHTCWLCQEFQYVCEIRYCKGEFDPAKHKMDFLFRVNCFENYLKEELGCRTDHEVVNLVRNEGLCDKSLSGFNHKEIPFLEIIDTARDLTPKQIYSAENPTRFSELIHWRTILELIKYNDIRGVISGNTIPIKKMGLVETTCDLTVDYIHSPELGDVKNYVFLRNPCATETLSVITEINITRLHENQDLIETLLNENEIKISLGMHPKDVQACNSSHLESMMKYLINPKIVALGNVGLDATLKTPMSSQISVLKSFLQVAKKTKKPIRIFSKGCHSKILSILKESLEDDQKIHYTNADLTMGEALELLIHFSNSYIGVSKKTLSMGSPGVEMSRRLSLSKLIPSSYAFTHLDEEENSSFNMDHVIQMLGRVRMESRHSIAKQIRKNIIALYQF